ncbi:MAG: cobalamin-dependent protein [Candidatus Omnitrophica bacterium]|nr:cobalamin-dependent protein [Candidatus Omnitrophota bacterium]
MKRQIKKVLLFVPPAFTFKDDPDINPLPPLGLAYLAAVLENENIKVKIVDCLMEGWDNRAEIKDNIIRVGLGFDEIAGFIKDFSPDIVGVNNLFTRQRENGHAIYKLAKKISGGIITVAGGAHPTVMPEAVLSDKNVDFVVIGEGEQTFLELIRAIEGEKEVSGLDGIAYRDNGSVKLIPKTRFIQDLDALPFPARHLLAMEKYFGLKSSHGMRRCERFSPIITSRGCPIGCTFCSAHRVWGKMFRKRSPRNVIDEMAELKNKYGIEELLFEDDNVTLDVKRSNEIFDLMIKEKMGFKWDTPNGVAAFSLDEPTIDKMQAAGCYKLNIAVESGSEDVLKNILKKPVDLKKVKSLIKYAKSIDLDVNIFLIIGMPGETIQQMKESYRFAEDLGIYDPFVSVAAPYPGSELYTICLKKGYISNDFLDDLYITSCSISTDAWDGEDIRRVFKQGYNRLRLKLYRKHPVLLLNRLIEKILR